MKKEYSTITYSKYGSLKKIDMFTNENCIGNDTYIGIQSPSFFFPDFTCAKEVEGNDYTRK